jgi:hypothetical protein
MNSTELNADKVTVVGGKKATSFASNLSMFIYSALIVFAFTLLATLISFDVIRLDTLTNPDTTAAQKALFLVIAVPLALVVCVVGVTVLSFVARYLLAFVDDRKVELAILAVLGLAVFGFMWYVGWRRRESQEAGGGGMLPGAGSGLDSTTTSTSAVSRMIWETVKLPYRTVLEGVLFAIRNAAWLLFGLGAYNWLSKKRVGAVIGYFVFLAAFLGAYYFLSFY